MGTLAEKLQKLAETKAAIKAAIIGKGQPVADSDTFASYADKIKAIFTGTDTSDADITASDVRNGKIAYGKNGKVVGSIPDVEVATPSLSMGTSGKITATVTQSGGYVTAGTKSTTYSLSTMSGQTITPSSTSQTIATDGKYMLGNITVSGDANLLAENIKDGVTIFGVTGTAKGSGAVVGTYTGNAGNNDSTPQSIELGFQPKFVFVSEDKPTFYADAPWYYYQDYDVDDNRTRKSGAIAAYAFINSPAMALDSNGDDLNFLEITSTGFNVANARYSYKNTSGTATSTQTVTLNYKQMTYYYVAIP